jgi:ABC-type antimicrobial peptide transport system permease subunit
MMENLLLALGGALLGVLLAWDVLDGLLAIMPPDALPWEAVVRINAPVLLFTTIVTLLSTFVFGLVPALRAARSNLQEGLKTASRGGGGSPAQGRLRNFLVVSEVALSLVLLMGGGMLIRSFSTLLQVEFGYKPDHVLVAFASLGLILVSIGIYGVLSYSVSRRTQKIGIRLALGAEATDVRWIVMMSGLRWLLVGIGIGVPTSIALAKILQSRIWGIKSADPLTLVAVSLLLTVVGLAACYVPARRATKVDPLVALRYE